MRNVLAHAGELGRRVVSAFIGTAFAQDDAQAARRGSLSTPAKPAGDQTATALLHQSKGHDHPGLVRIVKSLAK